MLSIEIYKWKKKIVEKKWLKSTLNIPEKWSAMLNNCRQANQCEHLNGFSVSKWLQLKRFNANKNQLKKEENLNSNHPASDVNEKNSNK